MRFTDLRRAAKHPERVTSLDVFNCRKFPDAVLEMTNLVELHVAGRFERVPDQLGNLRRLRQLALESDELQRVPRSLCQLTALVDLELRGVFTRLPRDLGELGRLQHLDVSFCRLTRFPDSIGELSKLKELGARNNRLRALPDSIGGLTALEDLDLACNNISALPASIGRCRQLRRFDAPHPRRLPREFGNLGRLQELGLGACGFLEIPKPVLRCVGLRELYLPQNKLKNLAALAGSPVARRLRELGLGGNPLESLDGAERFTDLERLSIDDTQIQSLAPLEKLRKLRLVDVDSDFPRDEIRRFKRIRPKVVVH